MTTNPRHDRPWDPDAAPETCALCDGPLGGLGTIDRCSDPDDDDEPASADPSTCYACRTHYRMTFSQSAYGDLRGHARRYGRARDEGDEAGEIAGSWDNGVRAMEDGR